MFLIDDVLKLLFKSYVDGKYDERRIAAKAFMKLYTSFDECRVLAPGYISYQQQTDLQKAHHSSFAYSAFERAVSRTHSSFQGVSDQLNIFDTDLWRMVIMGSEIPDWMMDENRADTILEDIELVQMCLADFIKDNFSVDDLFSR